MIRNKMEEWLVAGWNEIMIPGLNSASYEDTGDFNERILAFLGK